MTVYLKLFRNAFRSHFAYKIDAVFRAIRQSITMLVQISVWLALYAFRDGAGIGANNIGLQTMIWYVIISAGVNSLVESNAIYLVEDKVRSGMIATDLIKPLHFQRYIFSISAGNSIYNFVFHFLPMLVIFAPIFGMYTPRLETIAIFAITLMGGMAISFLLSYILGLVAFWYMQVWHLGRLLYDFTRLFAGSFIPLWFFPDTLYSISLFLPFRFIFFVPISIFLEDVTLTDSLWLVLQQWAWIGALFLLTRLVWRKAQGKLVVQGG